jgi:hypothetical protein
MDAAYARIVGPPVYPDVRRQRAVYCIPTAPVDRAGRIVPGPPVVGYIGQTQQTVKQREGQHRDDKPFGDLIVGGSWVIEEGWWTEAELDARERHYIRRGVALMRGGRPQRPIYNHDHNLGNRARVPIPRQVRQRQVREPGWKPPKPGRGLRVPRQRSGTIGWGRGPQMPKWKVRLLAVATQWLLTAVGLWWLWADSWYGLEGAKHAAGWSAALVAFGWTMVYLRRGKRQRRRGRRR